jgi:Zn-dependent M28 family amino/carboxypeptidase
MKRSFQGIQRGTERPNDVVIIQGHIDSRVTDVMNFTSDAPGANDDGSGVAAVLEAARVLSKHKFPGTIVYAVLSGEEQGLYGGKVLANYAKAQGWNVVTVAGPPPGPFCTKIPPMPVGGGPLPNAIA